MKYAAKTFFGLEDILVEELQKIGANDIKKGNRAVEFSGGKEILYKANLHLRTALRVLKPVYSFTAKNENELYKQIYNFKWEEYLQVEDTFAIDSTVSSEVFTHSKYVSLKTKDAIADRFRKIKGARPSVDIKEPELLINLHIHDTKCTVSMDSSGGSLHKRGYRSARNIAPLNEALAAALVLLSGWKRDCDFYDPMCGSGTIPIEAALYAYNIPPGMVRKNFGFMKWKDFDENLWLKLLKEAKRDMFDFKYKIFGSDRLADAIKIAKENAKNAGLENQVNFSVKDFIRVEPLSQEGLLIMNPPYGERIKSEDITGLYKKIGDTLKQNFKGFDAWIISSNKDAMKSVGLKTSRRMTLYNGPLEVKYHKYSLYEGSKKRKYQDE